MASRTWVAVITCCAIWLVYLQWFAPPSLQTPVGQAPATQQTTPSIETGAAASAPVQPAASLFSPLPAATQGYVLSNTEQEIHFATDGGRPAQIKLAKYRTTIDKNSPPITPVNDPSFSLGTLFTDAQLKDFASGTYGAKVQGRTAEFVRRQQGVELRKTYEQTDGYVLSATYRLTLDAPSQKMDWGYLVIPMGGQGLQVDHNEPLKSWEVVAMQNDKVVRKHVDSLTEEEEILQGNTAWLAFGNRYFSTAVVNESQINPDVVFFKKSGTDGGYLRFPVRFKEGERSVDFKFKIYSGPKDYTQLSKLGSLNQLIDYGWFSMFAIPLVKILKFFHSLIPNYGVAIILLTIFVRIVFYPLQAKSVRSMKAMQKLQPQIATLRERYKDDMAKFNQEQMALFRAHKVNPMGGCLPILVQLPVLFALYSVIGNSIELFHAPFFGWIKDLSTKDPYYVYPVLMGVSMFVQQKLTPSAGMDPAQQKIMLFMPVLFSFMMVGLPSGLTMYIFVSTVLGIAQQVLMKDKEAPAKLASA